MTTQLSGPALSGPSVSGPSISGLWVPLITPFKDGAVDIQSYDRLVEHYIQAGADALFPLGTTEGTTTVTSMNPMQLSCSAFAVGEFCPLGSACPYPHVPPYAFAAVMRSRPCPYGAQCTRMACPLAHMG